jgi:hypothetical protein
MIHCIKDGLSVIGKSVFRLLSQIKERAVKLVEVNPIPLEEQLGPNQQDALGDENPEKAESRVPEFTANAKSSRPGRHIAGSSDSL